jgi:predicted RNA-binding Zn ribbon-like protein
MKKTITRQTSDWRNGFLFLGNHLALDFLNTCPVQNGELRELLPDFDALLRWFEAAELLTPTQAASMRQRWGKSARAKRTLEAALHLREELRKEVLAWESGAMIHGSTLDELNRLMEEHPARTRLTGARRALSKEQWFKIDEPEHLLGPLADSAAALFADVDRERVRKCGECVLHFHDTSKKGTRRWCSMQLCGNRLKVAAYAARQRTP